MNRSTTLLAYQFLADRKERHVEVLLKNLTRDDNRRTIIPDSGLPRLPPRKDRYISELCCGPHGRCRDFAHGGGNLLRRFPGFLSFHKPTGPSVARVRRPDCRTPCNMAAWLRPIGLFHRVNVELTWPDLSTSSSERTLWL